MPWTGRSSGVAWHAECAALCVPTSTAWRYTVGSLSAAKGLCARAPGEGEDGAARSRGRLAMAQCTTWIAACAQHRNHSIMYAYDVGDLESGS